MLRTLTDILKEEGAITIISDQKIEHKLIFRVIAFLDKKKQFKELEVVYNEDMFFIPRSSCIKFLQSSDNKVKLSIKQYIRSYISVYANKQDYIDNAVKLNKDYICKYIDRVEESIINKIFSMSNGKYTINRVILNWYPIITILIKFVDKDNNLYFERVIPSTKQLAEGEGSLKLFRQSLMDCKFLENI